ncbi:hypothetical protein ABK040_010577 [Willaertia magna]
MSSEFLDEEVEVEEEDENEAKHKQLLREDDEDSEEEEGENLDTYEKDDFIVSDEEIEEDNIPPLLPGEVQGDTSTKRKTHPGKKKKKFKRLKRGGESLSREVSDLLERGQEIVNAGASSASKEKYDRSMDEMEDEDVNRDDMRDFIVREGRFVDEDIFDDDEEELGQDIYMERDDEEKKITLKELFGPDILKEKFLTEEDERIKQEDAPERILLRQGIRKTDEHELYNEAVWIYSKAFMEEVEQNIRAYRHLIANTTTDEFAEIKKLFVETIIKVLNFILKYRYDIPYISQYKKEDFEDILYKDEFGNDRDLWRIFEWDEKWCILQSKKKKLKDMFIDNYKLNIDSYYLALLDEFDSVDDVNDLQLYFTFIYRDSFDSQVNIDIKKPTKRDLYTIAKRDGLGDLSKLFGISPKEYADNLNFGYVHHEQRDCDEEPNKAAERLLGRSKTFNTVNNILKGAIHILANQIVHEPTIRQRVRTQFQRSSKIKMKLTTKGRATEDVTLHEFTHYNPNDKSSPGEYTYGIFEIDPVRFVQALKYETLGLLKIKIYLEDAHYDELFDYTNFYFSNKTNPVASKWNEQRKKVFDEAKVLFNKTIPHYMKNYLKSKGCDKLCEMCERSLTSKLMEGPYGHSKEEPFDYEEFITDENPRATKYRILSCIPGGEERERTTWVMLDENGEVAATKVWPIGHPLETKNTSEEDKKILLQMRADLVNLIRTHRPAVIAIATCGGLIFKKIKEYFDKDPYENFKGDLRVPYEIVPDDIARIYENSTRAKTEFPNENVVTRRAISVGRRLRDPLTEIAGLFNNEELLCVKFHPLQDMIPKDQLVRGLEKSLVRVVNRVGVEFNRVVSYPSLQNTLRFVSGLGPRKADLLLQKIRKSDEGFVMERDDISNIYFADQKNVATNCVGFLIIRKPPQRPYNEEETFNIINATRVHPLSYPLAKKMAEDGLDVNNLPIENIYEIVKNSHPLDELDLDAYADELEKLNYGRTHTTLKDIKEELKYPFKDPRNDFKSINGNVSLIFEYVTGETDETLKSYSIVLANVVTVLERIAFCKLDNGLFGVVTVDNINEQKRYKGIDLRDFLKEGEYKYFVIVEVVKDEFKVRLSRRVEDFIRADPNWNQSPVRYESEIPEAYQQSFQQQQQQQQVRKRRFRRTISHPAFKDCDYAEAKDLLKNKADGELIIRSSSKGFDHLAITVKYANDLYINYDVEERDKADANSLGRTLVVNGKKFSDLDEVIHYCVDNLMDFTHMLIESSGKFENKSRDEIKEILREEKRKNPNRIPYRVGMSTSKAAKFYIYYLPGRQTVKEKIVTVTPDGYEFNKRTFQDTVKLFNAFKRSCQEHSTSRNTQQSGGKWDV